MERRLGRGLGSLLGAEEPSEAPQRMGGEDSGLLQLELGRIRPNPFQPRKSMDPAGLEELRDSIANHGILQPVVVRAAQGGYELISGERRWRAARLAGLSAIPAMLRADVSDADMLELALVENVQRRDLDPIERAQGFQAIMNTLQVTQEGVAAKVGLKRSTVANHLRLLELPAKVQEAIGRGLITMGHGRALLALPNAEAMTRALERVVRDELSVRDVERMVRAQPLQTAPLTASVGRAESSGTLTPVPPVWAQDLERRIREHLGTKAVVVPGPGATGRIVLEYFSREGLDRLCDVLAPRPTV
jgi:ParB family chromosome partitioning protein